MVEIAGILNTPNISNLLDLVDLSVAANIVRLFADMDPFHFRRIPLSLNKPLKHQKNIFTIHL